MTAPKFKVGDRVRALQSCEACDSIVKGNTYVVVALPEGYIESRPLVLLSGQEAPWDTAYFELAETKNPNPKKAFGAQKPDLALIPPVAELHMAMAFENGASRYGAFNWRKDPVEAMTYIAAARRHLGLFLDGQDYSSDAMVHNLGHVMACCAILIDSQELGILIDNRPAAGKSEEVQQRLKEQKMKALK